MTASSFKEVFIMEDDRTIPALTRRDWEELRRRRAEQESVRMSQKDKDTFIDLDADDFEELLSDFQGGDGK